MYIVRKIAITIADRNKAIEAAKKMAEESGEQIGIFELVLVAKPETVIKVNPPKPMSAPVPVTGIVNHAND